MSEAVMATSTDRGPTAFEDFVASRGDALWRSAWLLTGDTQLAEDLVQTALAKSWPKWGVADEFEAYVRRTMFTTYVAWWRRRWNGELPTQHPPETKAYDGDPAARRDLAVALSKLPRGQRAVVVLRYFEDLTERQTAEVLGCSVGTVKSQCSRALVRRTLPAGQSVPAHHRGRDRLGRPFRHGDHLRNLAHPG